MTILDARDPSAQRASQGTIDRMRLIEQLQMRRNVPVRLFNQLPSLVAQRGLPEHPLDAEQYY